MKQEIVKFLDGSGINYRWLDHVAVFTVQDAALLGEEHVPIKNLLVQDEGGARKFLVVMAGDKRLDMKYLKQFLGVKKLRFASNETLMETFGVAPGSVSVLGMLHSGASDTEVLIDEGVLNSSKEIGFHPNDNTATIFISAQDLEPILIKMDCKYKILKLY